jgi:alpha-1,2-mannosyltransferase
MSSPNDNTGVRQRHKPPVQQTKPPSTPAKGPQQQQAPSKRPFAVNPRLAFTILFAAHTIAALFQPIQDCDEVFNYWEPTHYLTHGHAFQTWEYSPDYAIRSWPYTGLHALLTLPFKLAGAGKEVEFYALRITLGAICALCETILIGKVSAVLNPRIGITLLGILGTSPGMFHASISYLPSSFAMYSVMLGMANFMDWRGGLRTAEGIWSFGIAATLGWPFAAALSIPFLLEELVLGLLSDRAGKVQLLWRLIYGTTRTAIVILFQVLIDTFFYKKVVFVPFNIVFYNVFSKGGGPDLYGTEPWHFYLRNLFLNFHVWLPLALLSLPLLLIYQYSARLGTSSIKGSIKATYLRGIVFLTPFYLWLAIFTLQPHKEERFMYPAYPCLALSAAVALHILLAHFSTTDARTLISKIPIGLRLASVLLFLLAALALSVFRTLGTMTAYQAPLSIYTPLHAPNMSKEGDFLCLGKEWYRFPSHYLLPEGVRAKFIKSEFSGLLPGEFSEAAQGFGFFPGTWLVPPGMNDQNSEDRGKYTDIAHCKFVVDSHLPSTETTALEPSYIQDHERWEKIACEPFLDAASTGVIGRLGWIPSLPFVPARFRRVWGEYCLLKRKERKMHWPEQRTDGVPNIQTLQ